MCSFFFFALGVIRRAFCSKHVSITFNSYSYNLRLSFSKIFFMIYLRFNVNQTAEIIFVPEFLKYVKSLK